MKSIDARQCAVRSIRAVVFEKKSLKKEFADIEKNSEISARDLGFYKECAFGVLRHYDFLNWACSQLLKKPPKSKEAAQVLPILWLGIYQLYFLNVSPHAAIYETVELSKTCIPHAKNMVNAVLRSFLRQQEDFKKSWSAQTPVPLFPQWLFKKIETQHGNAAAEIAQVMLQKPPLTVRVNRSRCTREQFLNVLEQKSIEAHACLYAQDGVRIETAISIPDIPGFKEHWFYVQDEAAQLAVQILNPNSQDKVLEIGAAPGGKTTHLLEYGVQASHLTAVESDKTRATRLMENLKPYDALPQLLLEDARSLQETWTAETFDKIILDAPCSATGVIRRHPDIKFLREKSDISKLKQLQNEIIRAVWPLLKRGGTLLYITCSILKEENEIMIEEVLPHLHLAHVLNIESLAGIHSAYGMQILPGMANMDGFFFSLLRKA